MLISESHAVKRNIKRSGHKIALVFALQLAIACSLAQSTPKPGINRDALIGTDFDKRVADYMKLHQQALTGLKVPQTTDSAQITAFQHQFAAKIRALRPNARQGEIFTSEVADWFHRLIAQVMAGPDGAKIRASFEHAEPIRGIHLDVNQSYPDGLPLQSMPPSLLLNLPRLPKGLEYRFVGPELVLRDIPANLIVDAIPDVTASKTQ
jgi:hypothetical protein